MSFFRNWRRRRLRSRPFDTDWDRFLRESVPLYDRLSGPDRRELQGHVLVFLAEKRLEGCAGLKITDEVRLTIASVACMLLLHRPTDYFSRVITVLVYPGAYVAPAVKRAHGSLVTVADESRAGEAWSYGAVVLSWDDVLAGGAPDNPGHNIVIHEFAHELDVEHGLTRSVETTAPREYAPWARTLREGYEKLREDIEHYRPHVLDDYGATNLTEFFAVATETFFMLPAELHTHHRELYLLLQSFYHLDPASFTN